jgi:hypothetical protein
MRKLRKSNSAGIPSMFLDGIQTKENMSSPSVFKCEKCKKATDHSRINDPYAGELWQCVSCGWKTIRDESKSWAKVTAAQSQSPYEELYNRDMADSVFRSMVHHMSLMMVGVDTSGRFSAAQSSRIAAIILRNFDDSDEQIAANLKAAGFDLEGMMSTPAEQVANFKRVCEKKYRETMGSKKIANKEEGKWWQLWKRSQ